MLKKRIPCLLIPLCPDGVDEVNGEDKSAEAEEDPEDPLGPVAPVLGDVAQPVQGAGLAVLLDDGDAGHVGTAALVKLLDPDGDGVGRAGQEERVMLLLLLLLLPLPLLGFQVLFI